MKETQNIEWKLSWRDEYLKWICGFANAEGGTLVIGKNDKGELVGVANAKRLLEEIPNKVRDILGVVVAVNLHTQDGRDWLEIVVNAYPSPISYRGEYHLRSGSTKQELKGAALDRFLLRKLGRHWDGVPVPHVTMQDLEPRALAAFRKMAIKSGRLSAESLTESDAVLIEKLHLTEGHYLKRAATLLFHSDPEKFTTGACIKMGFFRTDSDLLYHDVIEGDLLTQAEKTLDVLLTKYLRAGISYQGTQRLERFPVPEPALREAIINAIAHKDYGALIPTQISVYDHKLIIWNAGQLPPDWSLARLMTKHPSQPANPDIAHTLFLAGKIEAWGRGIDLIRHTCAAYGSPEPQFACDSAGFWVEFPFLKVDDAPNAAELVSENGLGNGLGDSTPSRLLLLIKTRPTITLVEMSQQLGVSTTAIEKSIKRLKAKGLLQRVGSTRSGNWVVSKELK